MCGPVWPMGWCLARKGTQMDNFSCHSNCISMLKQMVDLETVMSGLCDEFVVLRKNRFKTLIVVSSVFFLLGLAQVTQVHTTSTRCSLSKIASHIYCDVSWKCSVLLTAPMWSSWHCIHCILSQWQKTFYATRVSIFDIHCASYASYTKRTL